MKTVLFILSCASFIPSALAADWLEPVATIQPYVLPLEDPIPGPTLPMALSPDGKRVLVINSGQIQAYDADTGALLQNATIPFSVVSWIVYTPDGSALLVGSENGFTGVSVFDPILLDQRRVIPLSMLVGDLPVFVDGGKQFLFTLPMPYTSSYEVAGVIDIASAKMVQKFDSGLLATPWDNVMTVFQSSRIAWFPKRGGVPSIANWPDLSAAIHLETSCPGPFRTAEFNADGSLLLAASAICPTELWDARTGKLLRTFGESYPFTTGAFFLDNDAKILTAHSDGNLRLWDQKTGALLGTAQVSTHGVHILSLSQDRTTLATMSRGHDVRVWKLHLK